MKLFRTTTQHPNYTLRCYPEVGEPVPAIGNCSEVIMYMRLDDKPIDVELVGDKHKMVQLWVDHRKFSFPILPGEGGFYCRDHDRGVYYTYVDESRLTPEQLASIQPESEEAAWLQATSGTRNGERRSTSTPTDEEKPESPAESVRQKC
jgi:hypothetical protein